MKNIKSTANRTSNHHKMWSHTSLNYNVLCVVFFFLSFFIYLRVSNKKEKHEKKKYEKNCFVSSSFILSFAFLLCFLHLHVSHLYTFTCRLLFLLLLRHWRFFFYVLPMCLIYVLTTCARVASNHIRFVHIASRKYGYHHFSLVDFVVFA